MARISALVVLIVALVAPSNIGLAYHPAAPRHEFSRHSYFHIHAPSIGSVQAQAIANAAKVWETEASLALQFTKLTISSGDPHLLWDDGGVRLVWEDNDCPPTDWGTTCVVLMADYAASALTRIAPSTGGHTTDIDTIFKQSVAWESADPTRECYGSGGDGGGNDEPGINAPGDRSPFKGDKNDNGTWDEVEHDSSGDLDSRADQFSTAFHEFIHWQSFEDLWYHSHTEKVAANPHYEECWSDSGAGPTAEAVRDDHDVPTVNSVYAHSH